jgi:5-methyltetrahydropteroyltriglutamate--homocysteine methyltransferase
MQIQTALVGSYPRPVNIAKVLSKLKSGKIEKQKAEKEIEKFLNKYFQFAKDSGLDYVTDGMIEWDDIADLTTSFLKGVEKGALERFFDNNFYYRRIVIKDRLQYNDNNEYIIYLERARKMSNLKLKAVVLGPLTFSVLSDDLYYKKNIKNLFEDYAMVVNTLLKEARNYYDVIEIHEPAIFSKGIKKDLIEPLRTYYNSMLKDINAETHVLSYFDLRFDRMDAYLNLPVNVYGFDVTESNKVKLGRLYRFIKDKEVYFGVLDSRNTKLERISTIKRIVLSAYQKGAKRVIIGNSTFNDLIPEVIVKRKFKLLKRGKEMILNG